MAIYANGDNVKPVLRCVAKMMMVLFCLFTARALQRIRAGQFASFNSVSQSITSLTIFRMAKKVALRVAITGGFALWAMLVTLFYNFAVWTLSVMFCSRLAFFCIIFVILFDTFQVANFAIILAFIFCSVVLIKLRERFRLFAHSTGFHYNFSSHFRLLNRRFWLEPVAGHAPAVGSSYYTQQKNFVNGEI